LDNPTTESSQPLSVSQAAALFGGGDQPEQEQPAAQASEPAQEAQAQPEAADPPEDKPETQEEAPAEEAQKVTIQVDGKTVELTPEQIAEAYKSGLRQADYTRKTMEAAEQRKAAEAESRKASEERTKAMSALQQAQAVLQAQLQEQSQIDWQQLLKTDPVAYLEQDRIARERHAKLQQIAQEQQQLHQQHQAEQTEHMRTHLMAQRDELLAKLPEWKDEGKAKAEKAQLREYLVAQGFDDKALDSISDHRAVLLSRKAMLYDQMMAKAQAAAKKVQTLPQKVERPGGGETQATDGRTAAMKQLQRTGSLRDAARVFEKLF
jgi:hypothetical protein